MTPEQANQIGPIALEKALKLAFEAGYSRAMSQNLDSAQSHMDAEDTVQVLASACGAHIDRVLADALRRRNK